MVFLRSLRTNHFLQHIIIILSENLNIKSMFWHLCYHLLDLTIEERRPGMDHRDGHRLKPIVFRECLKSEKEEEW